MNQHGINTGGLKEAKDYMIKNDIPQLFESMMTALMYERPEDHLKFLEDCLKRAKVEETVRWQTFIEPLPQIPKADGKIKSEVKSSSKEQKEVTLQRTNFAKKDQPLPPISLTATPNMEESIDHPNQTTEKVFEKHMKENKKKELDRPWYAEYIERNIDTSCLAGKPVIFVLGGPGSGKGTQCQKIAERYKFAHLSAGDLLRGEVAKGSDIGRKIDMIMKEGQLVPQDVTIALLKENLVANSQADGFLVDGFPREIKQGQQFERQVCLAKLVLNYVCPDGALVERLLSRAKHSGRVDDNEESIKKRLVLFHSKTEPVVKYYEEIVANIEADRSIEDVFADTCDVIENRIFDRVNISKPVIFVMGGPASGKTTQCAKLAEQHNLAHISIGNLLKRESEKDTHVGVMIKEFLLSGDHLVPLDIVMTLIKDEIRNQSNVNGYLLNGFPRDVNEATRFEVEVCPALLILAYNCRDETLRERLVMTVDSGDSFDKEYIEKKISHYNTITTSIFLSFQHKIKLIDGSRSVESVFLQSSDAINALLNADVMKETPTVEEISVVKEAPVVDKEAAAIEETNEEVIVAEEETKCESTGEYKHLLDEMMNKKKLICIVGGPCSGKTTQSEKLSSHLGYKLISVKQHLEQGALLNQKNENEEIISEAVYSSMIAEEILRHDTYEGYIIDGFPTRLTEAEALCEKIRTPDDVIYLKCSEEILKTRSDKPDRFDEMYNRFTLDLSNIHSYYEQQSLLKQVTADGSVQETFDFILEKVNTRQTVDSTNKMADELSNANIIFVLGGPGSGKGTQCEKIVAKYGFCHLSTGDLLREEVNSATERANKLKETMAKGELVSQETILELLRDAMVKNKNCKGFLIDGFPRDIPQGKKFEDSVGRCKCILYFHCTNEVMVKRLLGRAKTSGRVDDNKETIKKRLKTFEDQTLPVVQEFEDRVKQINAERGVDDIFTDVCGVLDCL